MKQKIPYLGLGIYTEEELERAHHFYANESANPQAVMMCEQIQLELHSRQPKTTGEKQE